MIAFPAGTGGEVCDMLTDVSSGHFLGGKVGPRARCAMMWPFVAVGFGSCPTVGSSRVEVLSQFV